MANDVSSGTAGETSGTAEPPAKARMTMHYRRDAAGRLERVWAPDGAEIDPTGPAPRRTAAAAYGERSHGASARGYSVDSETRRTAPQRRAWAPDPSMVRVQSDNNRVRNGLIALVFFVATGAFGAWADHHDHYREHPNERQPTSKDTFPAINPASEPPAQNLKLTIGQPATLQVLASVSGDFQRTYATVTITPTQVEKGTSANPEVNTVVDLNVCAGPATVPLGDLFDNDLAVNGAFGAGGITSDPDSSSFDPTAELGAGQCIMATQGFVVPGGANVTEVTFGGPLETQGATWTETG